MRVAVRKSTGMLIEMQSLDGDLQVLVDNAIRCGIPANDIEARNVTGHEYAALLAAQPRSDAERIGAVEGKAGMLRWERDLVIATLPPTHPQHARALAAEAEIGALGIRKSQVEKT